MLRVPEESFQKFCSEPAEHGIGMQKEGQIGSIRAWVPRAIAEFVPWTKMETQSRKLTPPYPVLDAYGVLL